MSTEPYSDPRPGKGKVALRVEPQDCGGVPGVGQEVEHEHTEDELPPGHHLVTTSGTDSRTHARRRRPRARAWGAAGRPGQFSSVCVPGVMSCDRHGGATSAWISAVLRQVVCRCVTQLATRCGVPNLKIPRSYCQMWTRSSGFSQRPSPGRVSKASWNSSRLRTTLARNSGGAWGSRAKYSRWSSSRSFIRQARA